MNLKNIYANGAAASGESITSSIPPKPGTLFDESFCPVSRFISDSAKSPNCPMNAKHTPNTAADFQFIIPKTLPNKRAITTAKTTAPAMPSQLFLGLILGENLCFPQRAANGVSPYISELYNKYEHQKRPHPVFYANRRNKCAKHPKIHNGKTARSAVCQYARLCRNEYIASSSNPNRESRTAV